MKSAKNLELSSKAQEHLAYWQMVDPKLASKILRMFDEISDTPYYGTGKPEALKHEFSGFWSRRIDREHRLVYRVEGNSVIILSCRFHY